MASQANIKTHTYLEYIGYNGKRLPAGYWNNKQNQKNYMEWLGKKLGYTTMEDWYKINKSIIMNNQGAGLISNQFNSSYIKLLNSVYPNYNWLEWKFQLTSRNYWGTNSRNKKINKVNTANVKKYIDWLGKELGYTTMEDWYKITQKIISENHGVGLLSHYYAGSIWKLLISVYPNYNWLEWKLQSVPKKFWKDKTNVKKYLDWLGKELGYTTMEDWYKICIVTLNNNYGCGLLDRYIRLKISLPKLIMSIYPNYKWDEGKFNNNKTEIIIYDFLLNNISNLQITNKVLCQYKPDWCINQETNKHLPYDFYIELANRKKIIIECDGEQHYTENSHFHRNDRSLEKQQDRDIFKMNKALENNVSIIRVHQEEVYNDTINWKRQLTDAINEIKNENEVTIKLLGCLSDKVCWDLK